jgi:hypothetical protein
MKMMLRNVAVVLLGTAACLLAGCSQDPHSNKPSGNVSVKVTYGGEPVTLGTVFLFSQQTGLGGGADLNEEGIAQIRAIPLGDYIVTVGPPELDLIDPNPPQLEYANIPKKFQSDSTSPLRATVTQEDATVAFELKE